MNLVVFYLVWLQPSLKYDLIVRQIICNVVGRSKHINADLETVCL